MKLRIAGYAPDSVVDGPGIRFVLFTQGCCHDCEGCHNPKTHDPEGGDLVAISDIVDRIKKTRLIRGVTFSGGEPFLQAAALVQLARQLRALGLNIVTYSGFTFEQLLEKAAQDKAVKDLLSLSDILVDGPYVQAKRDLSLAFRGSRNQRLVDLRRSLKAGQAVEWDPEGDIAEVKVLA
jgi:anaerobic ribonucleoside-triphosphate reductase activating protein